ncbi:unnamed protein product [Porites lobata]|uniref:Ig-like domain-containing protein n=1 Tax=Porites lobata TaxID=104759 RepID=A0ABN8QBB4_9CNID|nr:unnamed protein product [Porites lobata]
MQRARTVGSPSVALLTELGQSTKTVRQLVVWLKKIGNYQALDILEYKEEVQIIKQPKSQPVRVGGSVTLRCEATGYPAPRYQWVKDGAELLDGINGELILDTVTMYDSGNYFCLVSNHVNAEKSDAVDLEVLPSSGVIKEDSIEGIFTSEGGVMAGGNIRLVCPPGALDDSLSVTITLEDPSKYYSLIVQKDLENDVVIAAPIVNLQPNGHSFRKPMKLTTSFKHMKWKWNGDDVFILHGTESRDGKVTWQDITKSSKINEAAAEVEVELKHFSLIMVLLRWTLIRSKDILSRFDLLSFDYTLLVLLNKTSPSSAHDMLALLFVSQDVYHEQFFRDDATSALVQLKKEGFIEVHERATDRLDKKRIYNHENLQVSIQLGEDYRLSDSQHRSFSFGVDSFVWWNGGKVIKLPLEWRNEVRYLCGTISVNGENGHANKKHFSEGEYRVSPRGQMHIRRLRKLATKITGLQVHNTDLVRYFSRKATILCNSVLRDCCLELNQDEAFSSSNNADSFVKQFIENRQPMLEDISTKYKLVCSQSDESRTSIFLAIVPHLMQTIKHIFVDHKKLVPHSGLNGLHEENVDQFLTSVLNARQNNRFRDLVYVECQILEKLCMKNHSKKPVAEITKWSKSLAIEQMLNFLERFFKHCLHDIRLHKRLGLFSYRLRDTLLTDDKEVDEDYMQDFANVLLSLVDFAKFHPSKLVRFELVDSKSSTLSSTSSDVENLVHDEYDDTYSQTFSIKKVSEDELQLGAAACVHIDGSICKKGAFQSVIMLNRSGMDEFNRCMSRFAPADIAVVKMEAENKHSGNLQIVLYASQKEKLSELIRVFKRELSEDMLDLRQSEVSRCYLSMRCIDFTKEKVLRLRLVYKWGSEAVALDSNDFVTFSDCSAGGACLPEVKRFGGLDNSLMSEDLEALSLTSVGGKFPSTSFDQLQKHGSAQCGRIEYHLHQTFNQVTRPNTCVIGNQATVNDQMPSQRALPESLNCSPKRSITEGRRSLPEVEDSKDRS